jgi:hypothetical protein
MQRKRMVHFYKINLKKKMKKQLQNRHKLYIIYNKRGHINGIKEKGGYKIQMSCGFFRAVFFGAIFFASYHNSSGTIL